MHQDIFNIETLGEAMRPDPVKAMHETFRREEQLRLSRKERDYIAGHALDSMSNMALTLHECVRVDSQPGDTSLRTASDQARKIAALSNLLGDIGWEREATIGEPSIPEQTTTWKLGELFPVAQLRPWLEEWQRQDDEALVEAEREVKERRGAAKPFWERLVSEAQTKLGTGAILLARIEKWMASHEN